MNPVERVKELSLPIIMDLSIKGKLKPEILTKIEYILEAIEINIEELIKKEYLLPIREKRDLIQHIRKERDTDKENIESQKSLIAQDIIKIKELLG